MKITIPVEFEVTDDIRQAPMTLQVTWLEAEHDGFTVDLTCGAGVGNTWLQAHAALGDRTLYAFARITPLGQKLFAELESQLREDVPS